MTEVAKGRRLSAAICVVREPSGTYTVRAGGDGTKPYDLEERTFQFAVAMRAFVKCLPRTIANIEDMKQLVRASGSVGANYIEANEALGKKDFIMKIKICRKEAKESRYFLRLLDTDATGTVDGQRLRLIQEATELMNIFGSIYRKTA
jgi:four helix bundle protein